MLVDGADVLYCSASYIRLVNDGKDPWYALFGAAFVWVIIGVAPVAVAKMAWRFVS
ncbi:hypothetical protein OF867_16150 [Escherichia coli]|nr:hypothetical protein OF867_16150 [Escherichia coli]